MYRQWLSHADSFRQFKLSFSQPDTPEGYSEAQVTEALESLEPHLVIGDGAGSRVSQRMIDNHSNGVVDLTPNSPEYVEVTEWIDAISPCP